MDKLLRGGSKRLIVAATCLPYPATNGYTMRVWSLLNCLAAEGCKIDLVCFGGVDEFEAHRDEFGKVCRSVQVVRHSSITLSGSLNIGQRLAAFCSQYPYGVARSRSREMTTRISELLGDADAIIFEETNLLPNLPLTSRIPVIVDHHNVEHLLLRRYVGHASSWLRAAYAWLEALKVRRWENAACSRASGVLVCSDHDRNAFRELSPHVPVMVAPNVIDTNSYYPADKGDGRTLLYTGGMDWYPNRDAVENFAFRILPHLRTLVPGVRFVVAGRGPSDDFRRQFAHIPEIQFTGMVADMRPELAKATICVVPLRIGSGTRFKILEASAMGKAIVSTRLGAEGLNFFEGEEILLGDDPKEFARLAAGLLQDPMYRKGIGVAARRRVELSYSLPMLRSVVHMALETWVRGYALRKNEAIGVQHTD
jgi:glycosyltransferase involved in cell wall biosynthesis